jgi:ribosome-associated translation inhibitor RaiA
MVAKPSMPVSVVFRDMAVSEAVQAFARDQAAKLGRRFRRIVSCRVTVAAPPRKGHPFQVHVDVMLPGREIAAKSDGHIAPDDVQAALRDAFAAATRQVLAYAGRSRSAEQAPRL